MQQCSSLIVFFVLLGFSLSVKPVEEGSYEALIHNVTSCVDGPSWFHSNISVHTVHGRTFLSGIVVTKRTLKNPKFRVKFHYMESGLAEPMDLTNLNCHAIVVRVLLRALRIRYNALKCTLSPSTSEFKNLDINAILHTVRENLRYGFIRIRWEMATPTAKLICLDVNMKLISVVKT